MERKLATIVKRVVPKYLGLSVRTAAVNLSFKIIADHPTNPVLPPVLICHDILSLKKQWKGIGKTIPSMTNQSVVTVDLRNHGNSPHTTSHRYEEMAEDILALYDKLAIDKATLIGHSMGGRACMCVSLQQPKKVAGLIVIDISPVSTAPDFIKYYSKVMHAMKKIEFTGMRNVYTAIPVVKTQLKSIIKDDATMKAVLANITVSPSGYLGWSCNLDVLIKDFNQVITFPQFVLPKKYFGPTLFIGGQYSEHLPPDDLPIIRELFPLCVVKYIPKSGHNVHYDNPQSFLEHVIAFLRAISPELQ